MAWGYTSAQERAAGLPRSFCNATAFLGKSLRFLRTSGHLVRPQGYHWEQGSDSWLSQLYHVEGLQKHCARQGGRYWWVEVFASANQSTWLERYFMKSQLAWLNRVLLQGMPAVGVCMPATCTGARLRQIVVPTLLLLQNISDSLGRTFEDAAEQFRSELADPVALRPKLRSLEGILHVVFDELLPYSALDLTWAVIGTAHAGSSSLAMNLHRHPGLEVLVQKRRRGHTWEHDFFTHLWETYLPSRAQALKLNGLTLKGGGDRRLRGVKYPAYLHSDAALARLGRIPGLSTVVILRGPVERSEWLYLKAAGAFWLHHPAAEAPSLADCVGAQLEQAAGHDRCSRDVAAPGIAERFRAPLQLHTRISARIRAAWRFVRRDRCLLADVSELGKGAAFLNALASFLGVSPFPEHFRAGQAHRHALLNNRSRTLRTDDVRQALLAAPRSRPGYERGLDLLRHSLEHERRALRELLLLHPSARAPGELPAWALLP